jgi:hypothetical protein
MKKTAHGSRGRMAVAADLWRGLPSDVEIGVMNQGHRRLALDLAKLLSSVAMTHRQRRSGFKAAATLGFAGGGAQVLGAARVSGEGPWGCGSGLNRDRVAPWHAGHARKAARSGWVGPRLRVRVGHS